MYNNNTNFENNGANDSIRTQSIDLKIPIIIPGVNSSDSYLRMNQIDQENKKLKKKMKNKKSEKSKKKSSKKSHNKDEDEDDDDEEKEGPVVKVLSNEMPEGAADDSDDGKSKRDINDPHRALDINLDEYAAQSLYFYFLKKSSGFKAYNETSHINKINIKK